jgi:hypothetical protein
MVFMFIILKGVFTAKYNKKKNCYYIYWYDKNLFWRTPFCKVNHDGELIIYSYSINDEIMNNMNLMNDFRILKNTIKLAFVAMKNKETDLTEF